MANNQKTSNKKVTKVKGSYVHGTNSNSTSLG